MRITAKELRTIIKEEVSQVLMREETLEEGKIGKLETLLHTIVLGTTLGGLLDAVYHQEPTAPVAHVLDAMYEVAKDMPPGKKVTAGSFTNHVIEKIGGAIVPGEEDPSKDKMDESDYVPGGPGTTSGYTSHSSPTMKRKQELENKPSLTDKEREELNNLKAYIRNQTT